MRILVDKDYRDKVIEKIKDPVVKSFWTNEYSKWNDRVLQEVISPIQNKVGQFLSNFLIRNIVGQVKSTIDMRSIMDERKILILDLSKGRIGEDTMQLLGSMIVTKLYLAAMSRVDIPESERKDFYLYVDEFQNFATDSFASILSEARKYKLNLIVAHQYIEQLPEQVAAAIFGNVGTIVCFRVGANDAEMLVKEFTPFFTEEDLVNLPSFCIYLKLMIDGISSDPFSAKTLPPLFDDMITDNREKVIKVSRERYAHPRAVVEDKINRWSGIELSEQMMKTVSGDEDGSVRQNFARLNSTPSKSRENKSNNSSFSQPVSTASESANRKRVKVVCDRCKKESEVGFEPSTDKPIYCDDCFKIIKEERRKKKDQRTILDEEIKPTRDVVAIDRPIEAPSLSLNEALSKAPVQFSKSVNHSNGRSEVKSSQPSPKNEIKNNPIDILNNLPPKTSNAPVHKNISNEKTQSTIQAKPISAPTRASMPKLTADSTPAVAPEEDRLEWYEQAKEMLKSLKGDEALNVQPADDKKEEKTDKRDPSWLD